MGLERLDLHLVIKISKSIRIRCIWHLLRNCTQLQLSAEHFINLFRITNF